jgi:hypothetical protein
VIEIDVCIPIFCIVLVLTHEWYGKKLEAGVRNSQQCLHLLRNVFNAVPQQQVMNDRNHHDSVNMDDYDTIEYEAIKTSNFYPIVSIDMDVCNHDKKSIDGRILGFAYRNVGFIFFSRGPLMFVSFSRSLARSLYKK